MTVTFTLNGRRAAYDCSADDRLKGVYYQAVAKQKFDVYFVRKNSGTIRQP